MEKRLPGTGRRWGYSGLHRDEGCQLGDQHQTDDGDARASHELSHIQLNVKRAPKVFFGGKRKAQARCESVLID